MAALLLFAALTYSNRITDKPPSYDGNQNLRIAYNLAKYGIYSSSDEDNAGKIDSTMRREPFYPFVLAGWMRVVTDFEKVDLECLLTRDERCRATREILKWPQFLALFLLSVVTFRAGSQLSGSYLVGLASATFVGLNPYYLLMVDRHYTEIVAALLVLIHSYTLARLYCRPSLRLWTAAGLSLGLLVLTKAVFFYWLLLLAPLLLWLLWRHKVTWRAVVLFMVAASLLPALWVARNGISKGEPYISERGGSVLSIRAEYTTMSWSEYWIGYLYYTPIFRDRAYELLGEERFIPFERQNPKGYYRTVKNGEGLVERHVGDDDEASMRRYALEVMARNWTKQLALIPLFAYRGIFQLDDSRRFFVQATIPAWLFLFGSIAALYSRRTLFLIFALPVWYSIGFHAVLTHFIPRYSLPLLPVIIVCAFWTGWIALQHILSHMRKANYLASP